MAFQYETLRTPLNVGAEVRRAAGSTLRESLRSALTSTDETMVDATSAQWLRSPSFNPLCTVSGTEAVCDFAVAGCAVATLDLGIR